METFEGEDVVGDMIVHKKKFIYRFKYFIETTIFIISIIGAVLNSFDYPIAFMLWFVSNLISLVYFFLLKSYPLCLQQIFFLITTIIGIFHRFF